MAKKSFEIQGSTLRIGGLDLQAGNSSVVIPGVTQASTYTVEEVKDNAAEQEIIFETAPVVIDIITFNDLVDNGSTAMRAEYQAELDDDGYIDDIEVTSNGVYSVQEYNVIMGATSLLAYTGVEADPFMPFVPEAWATLPFRVKMKAGEVENVGGGGTSLPSQSGQQGKFLRTNGSELSWVNVTGAVGAVQPYLELTNEPFIIQPVELGIPVTITEPGSGQGGELDILIENGGTTLSFVVATAGTGYIVGQRYKVYFWQIGGNSDLGNLEVTVASVGEQGDLLSVDNAIWTGPNNDGTYRVSIEFIPGTEDSIEQGLTLTRFLYNGLYNSAVEQSYDSAISPATTLWNDDGWGTLVGLRDRSYSTFQTIINNTNTGYIGGRELVMWDTVNDRYYKFYFSVWDNNNTGAFSYTRTLVTDPNYFRKTDNGNEVDVIVEDDGDGAGIGITRDGNNGIYNPYRDEGWGSDVSPSGTQWNIDGWDDLSNIETRTYTNFFAAYDNGGLGNKVPGSQTVMYVPEIDKYYAVEWISWTQNNQGGGFSYTRRELDLTKLNEGVRFPDGTVLKSAEGIGRVKSTAPSDRRIEEVTGYNQVSVTSRITTDYTGVTSQTTDGYELRVARTPELDAVMLPINQGSVNATFTLSYDNTTFREVWLSSIQQTEYWFYYQVDNGQTTPQTENNPVYIRTITGADPVVWWNSADLPSGSGNFRGAVIDYHAYTGESTIIGTIHIVDDDGEEHISHQEVQSGSTDGDNDDLWLVTQEGQINYRRVDGESKTLKIHWTAKVFYGSEIWD